MSEDQTTEVPENGDPDKNEDPSPPQVVSPPDIVPSEDAEPDTYDDANPNETEEEAQPDYKTEWDS